MATQREAVLRLSEDVPRIWHAATTTVQDRQEIVRLLSGGRWAIWADDDELLRLKQLRAFHRKWPDPRYPAELTNPKSRARIE